MTNNNNMNKTIKEIQFLKQLHTKEEESCSSAAAAEQSLMGNKSSKSANNMDVKDFINQENSSNQVVIWSKSYCGYCAATKRLFGSIDGIQVSCHELDRMSNGSAIQNELANMTGQRSVPNVFVNNQHVGGNDDTQAAYRNGTLAKLLGVEKL